MPRPITDGALLQVRLVGQYQGQQTISTFLYQMVQAGGLADYNTAYSQLLTGITLAGGLVETFLNVISTGWTGEYIAIQEVHPERLVAKKTLPGAFFGTQAGTDMPPNVAATITRRGELASRSEVGALHVPGMIAENFDPATGDWKAVYLLQLTSLAEQMSETLGGLLGAAAYVPVLANLTATPPLPTDIKFVVPQGNPRVMRRRTKGIGI